LGTQPVKIYDIYPHIGSHVEQMEEEN